MNLRIAVLAAVVVCAVALTAGAYAQTPSASPSPAPTPSATPAPAATPEARRIDFRLAGTVFAWSSVADAAGYHLQGDIGGLVGRVGDTRCEALAKGNAITIQLNENLPADVTSFDFIARKTQLGLQDQFVGTDLDVTIDAVDQAGDIIAHGGPILASGGEAPSGCPSPAASARANTSGSGSAVVAPNTGDGAAGGGNSFATRTAVMLAVLGAFALAVGCAVAAWRRTEL